MLDDGPHLRVLSHPLPRLLSGEVASFLVVGGLGYVVDIGSFNLLRSEGSFATIDPSYARVCAVAVAMVVTYLGNRLVTWRGRSSQDRRREIGLFVLFNLVGLGLSVLTLVTSHDLLGLTSRLADNISANGIGVALGTLFRYWSYRTFVFTRGTQVAPAAVPETARVVRVPLGAGGHVGSDR